MDNDELAWWDDGSRCCDAERMRRSISSRSVLVKAQLQLAVVNIVAISAAARLRIALH